MNCPRRCGNWTLSRKSVIETGYANWLTDKKNA